MFGSFFIDPMEVEALRNQIKALQESNENYAESACNWNYTNDLLAQRVRRMASLRSLDGVEEMASKLAKEIDDAYVRSYDSIEYRRKYIAEKILRVLTDQIKGTPEWVEYMDRK